MNEKGFTCHIEEELPKNSNPNCNIDLNTSTTFPGKLAVFFDDPVKELIFNPDFEDGLRIILERQKHLNAIRAEFADEIYSKFIILESNLKKKNEKQLATRKHALFINDTRLTNINLYHYQGTYRAITFADYKLILVALEFTHSEWINPHLGNNKWVDFITAFKFHKINYEFYEASDEYQLYIERT